MIFDLLTRGDYAEFQVIFGADKLLTASAIDIFKFQEALDHQLTKGFISVGGEANPKAAGIMTLIAEGRGEFRAMKDKVAHSKIYLLDGKDSQGQYRRRVVLGSANLSETAFSGRQGEIITAFPGKE